MEDKIEPGWRTSSYTGNGGGNCVEVAEAARMILVRDTKDRGGVALSLSAREWAKFTASLKA
jgi:Domain of unknown function (DUF397)